MNSNILNESKLHCANFAAVLKLGRFLGVRNLPIDTDPTYNVKCNTIQRVSSALEMDRMTADARVY